MKKKELLSLAVTELVTDISVPDKTTVTEKHTYGTYKKTYKNYIYRAIVDNSTGEDVLVIDNFTASGVHLWRFFQDKKGDYFRRITEGNRISTAGMDYILNEYPRPNYIADTESTETIYNFLKIYRGNTETALQVIARHNRSHKEEKKNARYNRIRQSINNAMLEIRDMPEAVSKWIDESLMKSCRYIFYEYNGKKHTTGECSHCGAKVTIERPKDHTPGKCPNCKSPVTFIAKAKFARSWGMEEIKNFAWFQSTSKGFCIRGYVVAYTHYPSQLGPRVTINEDLRVFYEYSKDNGRFIRSDSYTYGTFYQTKNEEWKYDYERFRVTTICPYGLNRILKHEQFKAWHTNFETIARKCSPIQPENLVSLPEERIIVGHFANAGLYKMTKEIINRNLTSGEIIDLKATSIKKALQIPKELLQQIMKIDPSLDQMQFYIRCINNGDKSPISDYLQLFKLVTSYDDSVPGSLKSILAHMTVHRLIAYIKQQGIDKITEKTYSYVTPTAEFLSDYRDYLENAVLLGMNVRDDSVRFPMNFKKAHDEADNAVEYAEKSENGLQIPAIAQMENKLNERFYFSNKQFLIRAPHDHREIVKEGERLHHCVATYAKSVALGKTIILFIREVKEPDKPYFTLELNPETYSIIQCRGLKNCTYGADVAKFMDTWKMRKLTSAVSAGA